MSASPKILAVDTSTKIQVLGLTIGTAQVARVQHKVRVDHSNTLLSNINAMLSQHGLKVQDLDLVACGLGPGSFTGLRVGMANAKAIARAADAPIVGVSSLAAIARPVAALHDGTIVSGIDARRGEVFAVAFDNEMQPLDDEVAYTPDELHQMIEALAETTNVKLVGNGFRAHDSLQNWAGNVELLDPAWDWPSPYSIAMMAKNRLEESGPDDLVSLEPNYIRPSDAEISWKKKSS